MKSIILSLKSIKNVLPYLLLIAVYFFFINLESRKQKSINRNIEKELSDDKESEYEKQQLRISIPVIPYQ